MANFDDLLKKKKVKEDNAPKEQVDMKTRMQNVVNASKRLREEEDSSKGNSTEDLKAKLAKAMEETKKMEEMYADDFEDDKELERQRQAEKDARKKKLAEQQQKALEKLAALEKTETKDNDEVIKSEKKTTAKKAASTTKKATTKKTTSKTTATKKTASTKKDTKTVEVIKEVKVEVPVEKIVEKEVIKEVPVEVIKEIKVEVPVEKIIEKEVIKEVPVEVIKEVKVEVPVEKIVEKEVIKEVPVEIIKEIKVEVPVEKVIEKEVIKEVPVEVIKEVNTKEEKLDEANDSKKTEKPVLDFFIKTMNGMAYGLFATLIIGTIIDAIATIPFIENVEVISTFLKSLATVLKNLMGVGIGIGVAINMGFKDLKLIALGLAGGLATFMCGKPMEFFVIENVGFKVGDPLTCYITVIATGLLMKLVLKKKTSIDIIIVPLFVGLISALISYSLSPAITWITSGIGDFIEVATNMHPLLMGIIIAAIMGMALTAPISSAAIAAIVFIDAPLAGGAATIGCCCQMVGFAIQSIRDNKIGNVVSIGIGTSMLQFKNILRKPIIWLPTIIASIILGPVATCIVETRCNGVNAGMGTSGLVGIIGTIQSMKDGELWRMLVSVIGLEIIAPAALVFAIDLVFRKLNLIKKDDLKL